MSVPRSASDEKRQLSGAAGIVNSLTNGPPTSVVARRMKLSPLIRRTLIGAALLLALAGAAWIQACACTGGPPTWRSIATGPEAN